MHFLNKNSLTLEKVGSSLRDLLYCEKVANASLRQLVGTHLEAKFVPEGPRNYDLMQ